MPPADSASPYVLVHGFADDARTWQPLVPYLSGGAVHAPDLPGHGTRADTEPGVSLSRDAAVTELADHLERAAGSGGPTTLVGHSLGGYLALKLVIDRPELVADLVLISSGPGFRKPAARAQWNDYIDAIAAKTGIPAEVTALAHQPDSVVIDGLAAIRCRLVHVIGERDHRYRAGADYLRTVLPNSTLVVVEGAGHHPQRTHPDRVADAIAAARRAPRH